MFSLDLQARTLSLVFSEAIQVSSLSINQFSIQDRQLTPSQSFSFTSSSSTQSTDGTDISIDISNADFNTISSLDPLGTSIEDTFLIVTTNGAQDFAGNNIVPILSSLALRPENHSLDRTSPQLTAASLDSDSGVLRLEFDETVSLESFSPSLIRLQNSASTPSQFIVLSGGVSSRPISTAILLQLLDTDRNTIKSLTNLLTDATNSFISFPSSLVQDMHYNPISPVSPSAARAISPLTPDTTDPVLYKFDFDLDTGLLLLSFDETVDLSTLSVSSLSLLSSPGTASQILFLSNSVPSSTGLLLEVSLSLNNLELDLLKQREICLTSDSCFLSVATSFLRDTNSNPIALISASAPLQVTGFIPDTTQPLLLEFDIFDLNSGGLISLQFSETVRAASFNLESISLHERFANSLTNLSISQQSYLQNPVSDITINLTLSRYDLNKIKLDPALCISPSSCFLSVNSQLVTDQSGNFISTDSNSPFQPALFIYDTTPPNLVEWEISLASTGIAVFLFDEIISEASFDSSQLVFLNPLDTNETFSPSSGAITRSPDGFSIVYSFTQSDLDGIKVSQLICTRQEDCYLSFTPALITDVSSVPVVPRSVGLDSLQTSGYSPDRMPPYLVSFTQFNLETRSLNLLFNEPVDISTAVLTDLTIIKHRYTYVFITLGGGEIEWVDPYRKEVCLFLLLFIFYILSLTLMIYFTGKSLFDSRRLQILSTMGGFS